MIAQGAWDLTTGVTPPEGFIPDQPQLSASVADTTSAIQFTFTDVGSAWTETVVNQSIGHLGQTMTETSTIPMRNRKPTKARNDNVVMMLADGSVSIAVLTNDRVGVKAQSIALLARPFTQPATGGALAADNQTLIYTPNAGPADRPFTYTIVDNLGVTSTGTVTVRVVGTPTLKAGTVTVVEGNAGTSTALLSVVLANASVHAVTVSYATVDVNATAGLDYVAKTGTITFNPGDTRVDVPFDVIGDTLAEANEAFTVACRPDERDARAASEGTVKSSTTIRQSSPRRTSRPAKVT
jgi:hypothetical protein